MRAGVQQSGDSNFHVSDAHEAPGHPEFHTALNSVLNLSVTDTSLHKNGTHGRYEHRLQFGPLSVFDVDLSGHAPRNRQVVIFSLAICSLTLQARNLIGASGARIPSIRISSSPQSLGCSVLLQASQRIHVGLSRCVELSCVMSADCTASV
jgi:hypothetical protein